MRNHLHAKAPEFLAVALVIIVAPAFAQAPDGVSPGAVGRIAEVEDRCPTFIWGVVSGAMAYELVVFRLPEDPQASSTAEIDLSLSDQVLYAKVPGGASAWQPELAEGLDPGGSYVWFVRVVHNEEAGDVVEAGDWSAARFFSISPVPSQREIDEALNVLRRYTSQDSARATEFDQPPEEDRSSSPSRPSHDRHSVGSPQDQKSVPSAFAAVKGAVPDATGETFGVVGISNSPDGAGMGAANTAGGPDLVLDGSEDYLPDAELSESGINRPWGTAQTFNIQNSMGAGMTLQVDSVAVVTTTTDRDTLAGLSCVGEEVAKWSGSQWVCAPMEGAPPRDPGNQLSLSGNALDVVEGPGSGLDADSLDGYDSTAFSPLVHTHDGRYYTETELNTSGAGGAVNWNNLTAVPAGFADGVDDDTQYLPGPGLVIDNGRILIDPAAFSTRISTPVSAGHAGSDNSIAIGADDLGLISYYDPVYGDLKVAHCDATICSGATTTILDSGGFVGTYTSIAIGADGLGLISYYDLTNDDLKVAHCNNTACSSATTATLDSGGYVGTYTSIAIGADGLGLISYYDTTNTDLMVAHCNNIACSSATTSTLDSAGSVGTSTSIAIGDDGLGLISYYDLTNHALKVAHCNNTACSSATTAILDSGSNVGSFTSIAIGDDGLGLISYFDATNLALKVAHCTNTPCSSATTATLDSGGTVGTYISIAIGADSLGLISYRDSTNENLKVAHCNNTACSSATTATLDSSTDVGWYTSIAIGADGLGLISYFDNTTNDLKVAHLGIGVP